ncbi:hypothetical protein [Streptomyces sp. NBC_01264]|uniref:hypothetical protein n=1 Tax=Streptomyces sp. NBC_01264 TaxID=2903804 RepID=UPI002251597E|nr:hypothetical protein [Streptomyces sp. NBC_01264]MCX4782591.1 hypothetical protein [Streptomyces sp. NBC_01264]
MSETDPYRTSATLELPAPPADGSASPPAGPGTAPALAPGPAPAGPATTGRLRPPADREQQPWYRSDPREHLTDGIVELRKRRQIATHRTAGPADPADPESRLAAMARRAAERAVHPLA